MKRWIALVTALALVIGGLSVMGSLLSVTAATTRGDVNGDGTVATYDARMLLSSLVTGVGLTATQKAAADYNGDGKVNTTDVKLILRATLNVDLGSLSTVSLMAPDMDLWTNPVQLVQQSFCTVRQEAASDGVTFVNVTEQDLQPGNTGYNAYANPYTWPTTAHAYDQRILAPSYATISYDLTVASSGASVVLFLGGSRPHIDGGADCVQIPINSFMSSDLDSGSGDLVRGTYTGTISVSSIINAGKVPESCLFNGNLWISGIMIYVVGYNGETVTVRDLTVDKAYQTSRDFDIPADPYMAIKSDYVFTEETAGLQTLTGIEVYEDGERTPKTSFDYYADNKKIYYTESEKRVMNYPDGYQIDIPLDWMPDYSLSALRSRYESDTCVLTVSKEEENPYSSWETYRDEWLIPYISNESFLDNNYLRYTRDPIVSETMLPGYTVMTYDIAIDWQGKIAMPYYSIAIIRKYYTYDTFYLMVLKSSAPTEGMIDRLIRSFKEITVYGTAVNPQGQYEKIIPATWNAETRAYYDKLCNQNTTDWGFFSHSMVEPADSNYGNRYDFITSERARIEAAIGQQYDILPTYTHIGWGSNYRIPFPLEMAQELAGGNGYNGKPVLQFTYQYTTSNNSNLTGVTPIFNVLRGDYDAHFRQLARDIKTYKSPVLFRLNNEMNTDWTSYCGLVSLLDPDIFIMGWQYLYNIFQEEGVDNCIWIFNPFTPTTPYSSWGDTLCYMPGAEYVQILGLTNYEMGNSSTVRTFQQEYTEVYDESKDYFINYPWVISEFACGAGGEKTYNYDYDYWTNTTLGRNRYYQTYYINNMFSCLNNRAYYPFCQNIKAAIWFNRNDYVQIDGVDYIANYLELDDTATNALNAFKKGLAAQP
ncbi:MAG: hypothetical protein E7553_07665 [Ruminococcaceae bacterium]|nr:hypothetical protein [Oscillospiraceae bacterium]